MIQGNILLLIAVLWPMLGALGGYLVGRRDKKARDLVADAVTVSEFILIAGLLIYVCRGGTLTLYVADILGRGLSFELDGFRALYAAIAGFMWMMTTLFSREYLRHYRNRNRYYLFTLLTCGATVGVFLSADLFTTFLFFEVMSFTSYVMVLHDEKPGALRAGQTYLAVAILGGMVLLLGLLLLEHLAGTLSIRALVNACRAVTDRRALYLAAGLILFGFGAKAGMFPLHIWLPKAYPVAPAPASALLSGILTKAGVFGILVVSCNVFLHDALWGAAVLALGVVTMFLGAVLAVFSIDLKRTLACSSMSQIGFILIGMGMQGLLGEENALAVWGTELHTVNHSLIKLALFMAAGVVYMNLHSLDLNEVRGFGRGKPLLAFVFLMGYIGIIGVPLGNGYISKTLLHESIVEYITALEASGAAAGVYHAVEWIFLISGGLTAAYMTKLFAAIFLEKNPHEQDKMDALNKTYMNWESAAALGVSAAILPILGLLPGPLMSNIARLGQGFMNGEAPAEAIAWFSWANLRGAGISLAIGGAVYFGFIRTLLMRKNAEGTLVYVDRWPKWADLENALYRPITKLAAGLAAFFSRILASLPDWAVSALKLPILLRRVVREGTARTSHDLDDDAHVPQNVRDAAQSLSFGLLLYGVGFLIVMLYLLLRVLRL